MYRKPTFIMVLFIIVAGIFTVATAQTSPQLSLLAQSNLRAPARYADCWGYIGPDNREYALVSLETGIQIIDISDTNNLVEVAFFPGPAAIPGDIKTYQNYAYAVNDNGGGGMTIIDLSNLPASASIVANFNGFQTSHNIYIDEDNAVLYAEGDAAPGSGVLIYSLVNPLAPQQLSSVTNGCHDIFVRDNTLFVSEGGNSQFGIYDVTNPASPQLMERFTTPSSGFAHNAWTNSDNTLLMTTEETANQTIKIWDISDFSNITLLDEVLGSEGLAHNAVIKGSYGYVSHYSDGLLIYDITNPDSLVEVGHYDTYFGPNPGELRGAWGVYPFLKTGKVLVSDTETGLYVLFFEGAKEDDPLSIEQPVSNQFSLKANYPNPFNPQTTIEFELARAAVVTLEIFDNVGRQVDTPYEASLPVGHHKFVWNASDVGGNSVSSGVYFYRLIVDGQASSAQKMMLLK